MRLLTSEDDSIALRAMMFLVSMRDGRPAQQINVTSLGVNISASDVSRARELVRELTNRSVNSTDQSVAPLMLSGDDGGNSVR